MDTWLSVFLDNLACPSCLVSVLIKSVETHKRNDLFCLSPTLRECTERGTGNSLVLNTRALTWKMGTDFLASISLRGAEVLLSLTPVQTEVNISTSAASCLCPLRLGCTTAPLGSRTNGAFFTVHSLGSTILWVSSAVA